MADSDWVPSDDVLLAFDRGLLPDSQIDAVARWLEANPSGEERLRRLTEHQADEAAEALRQPCLLDEELANLAGLSSRIVSGMLAEPMSALGDEPAAVPASIREYHLVKELGKGGMGSVYLARHRRLRRDVALKLLPARLTADPWYRGRFEREMAAVGQLDHPNLVRAHDAGAEGEHLFLAMELLEGEDLAKLVAHHRRLPIADACEAARQAALGLHHAHQHGLVHRDVKPGNLFVTRTGTVKVIDLGLARVRDTGPDAERLSSLQTVIGTPDYMAPEQWESTEVDLRADLYGLGCTLFCLLTGKPPFAEQAQGSWVELVTAHRLRPPPSVRHFRAQTSSSLNNLVARLLAKNPDQRPGSALEVAKALEPFTAGHNLPALLTTQTQRLVPVRPASVPKRRSVAAVVLVAAVLMTLAGGLALWSFLGSSPPAATVAQTPTSPATPPTPAGPVTLQPSRPLTQHSGKVLTLAFSPDGRVLASGGEDRTILLWDTETWKPRGPLEGHAGIVVAVAFSPDSARLASITPAPDRCAIRLWDVATGRPDGTLGGEVAGLFGLAWSPDGRSLACGGFDRALHIWDVGRKETRVVSDVTERFVRGRSFSADGRWIVTGGEGGGTAVWDAATREKVPTDLKLPDDLCPTFLPGGTAIAGWVYRRGTVILCEVPSGRVRDSWRAHSGNIEGLAISPDGRFLATAGREGIAKVWATADRREVAILPGHRGGVAGIAFSPDGARLATGCFDDHAVHLWDLPAECRVRK